jgi:hypothetical protein
MRKKSLHLAVSVASSARWFSSHNSIYSRGGEEKNLQERPIKSLVLPQRLLFENPADLPRKQIDMKKRWLTNSEFGLLNTARILLQDFIFSLNTSIQNLKEDVVVLRS